MSHRGNACLPNPQCCGSNLEREAKVIDVSDVVLVVIHPSKNGDGKLALRIIVVNFPEPGHWEKNSKIPKLMFVSISESGH